MISSIVTRLIKQLSTTTRSQSIRQFLDSFNSSIAKVAFAAAVRPGQDVGHPQGKDKHRAPNDTPKCESL